MSKHPLAAFLLVVALVLVSLAVAVHAIPVDTIIRGVKAALAVCVAWLIKDLAIGVLSIVLAHRITPRAMRENDQVRRAESIPARAGREVV